MYVSNLLHFLDESGNIQKDPPSDFQEMAKSLTEFVNHATDPDVGFDDPRPYCFAIINNKRCDGKIAPVISLAEENIYWDCLTCGSAGVITHWQNTFWDLSGNDDFH
jgi:hypothetical protein